MPSVATSAGPLNLQGIYVPQASVDPAQFFQRTRRLTVAAKTASFPGFGLSDFISLPQTGILSGLSIKFSGSLVVALPTGTCASTYRWPYDLIRNLRFTANGQSNLINVPGSHLKLRDIISSTDLTDRGISRGVGGASPGTATTQGTLSLNNENWGVGSNVTAIPANTYPVELQWFVPIAADQTSLIGAIFAQTSSTDLQIAIDWAPLTDLFTLTLTATATLTGSYVIEPTLYSIPEANGAVVVPDLSTFHSMIAARSQTTPANGDNEIRLAGQGVGRQLMRMWFRTINTVATVLVPLAVNATNYGNVAWRYGTNDTPEIYTDGRHLAYANERLFGSDVGSVAGFGVWDFVNTNAFRDTVDEGAATELRLLVNIPSGVTLTTPFMEYTQETLFAGAVAA